MHIRGSIALITGGCQGFGKAFCIELLKKGGKVSIIDINESIGKDFLKQCQDNFGEESATFVHCDVTNSSGFKDAFGQTIAKYGKVDLVCNNAGGLLKNWKELVDLNLSSVIHGTNLAIDHMSAKKGGNGGVIINVGSIAGIHPYPEDHVYTATKFGVVGFSKSFKDQLKDDKIRVNCLCPSICLTGLVERAFKERPQLERERVHLIPIEDVAKGFLELVADDSRDGEILSVTPKGLFYVKATHDMIPVKEAEQETEPNH